MSLHPPVCMARRTVRRGSPRAISLRVGVQGAGVQQAGAQGARVRGAPVRTPISLRAGVRGASPAPVRDGPAHGAHNARRRPGDARQLPAHLQPGVWGVRVVGLG